MKEPVPIEAWHEVPNSDMDTASEEHRRHYMSKVEELLAEAICRSVKMRIKYKVDRGDQWTTVTATVNPFRATIDTTGEEISVRE